MTKNKIIKIIRPQFQTLIHLPLLGAVNQPKPNSYIVTLIVPITAIYLSAANSSDTLKKILTKLLLHPKKVVKKLEKEILSPHSINYEIKRSFSLLINGRLISISDLENININEYSPDDSEEILIKKYLENYEETIKKLNLRSNFKFIIFDYLVTDAFSTSI